MTDYLYSYIIDYLKKINYSLVFYTLRPSYSFYMPGFWQKKNIDDQKVQVADEIKHDIWKYLVSSDVADDAW